MKWCPHCNGYGSSLKEHSGRCTHCGGAGSSGSTASGPLPAETAGRRAALENGPEGTEGARVDRKELEKALREGYAALNRGEEPSLELIDDGFEGGNLPEEALGMPAMSGRDGLLTWIRGVRDVWDEFRLVPQKITWLKSDVVLVEVLLEGRGKASTVPVSQRFYNVWTIRNDRAVRLEVHGTQDEATRVVESGTRFGAREEQ
jgi:hypothetical protein